MATDAQAELTPELRIVPGAWCDEAAWWVAQAVRAAYLPAIRAQVEAGLAKLFFVQSEGATVGCFIVRIDSFTTHHEGVIVAAAGDLPGVDLMASCLPTIEGLFSGVAAIRYHTERPAVAVKMARHGYVTDEIICRKLVTHGLVQ
jgi:hypothetical protein